MGIKFTQFMRPDGQRKPVEIDAGDEVQGMADELAGAGWQFETEVLTTGAVHADCCNEDGQLGVALVDNGPGVPAAIAKMVSESWARWVELGKPAADGFEFPPEPEGPEEVAELDLSVHEVPEHLAGADLEAFIGELGVALGLSGPETTPPKTERWTCGECGRPGDVAGCSPFGCERVRE